MSCSVMARRWRAWDSSSYQARRGASVSMACVFYSSLLLYVLFQFLMLKQHLRLGKTGTEFYFLSSGCWEVQVRKSLARALFVYHHIVERGKEGQEDRRRNPLSQCSFRETLAPLNLNVSRWLYFSTLQHWEFNFQHMNSGNTLKP